MNKNNLLSILTLLSIIINSSLLAQEKSEILSLMPIPEKITVNAAKFRVAEDFTIGITGTAGDRLYRAATRTLRRLAGRTGLFLPQDYITRDRNVDTPGMIIESRSEGSVRLFEDESYALTVTSGSIRLTAETDIGALRGLETFLQLLDVDGEGYFFPAVNIEDSPRFPWRGLLIDAGRHFMPVDVIKRNLDGMAAVKLNVLHWHLTEDQGFRVECKTYPKLHEMGSDGFYYTQEQIKDIINYADDRGIRVMPEFDMPGHVQSWFAGHPEISSAEGPYEIGRRWGVMDPAMNPANENTYRFLDRFFKEMAALFPDEYMHIGGDENNGRHWNANEEIQEYMSKNNIADNHDLQKYFNTRILRILTKYGKKMVGWDEIFQPDLPRNIVIQSWRGKQALEDAARLGYQSILSNGYYIDLIRPTDIHYLNDPIPEGSPLTGDEKEFVLGGEMTMWGEYVSYETIDSRIWPRTAAIAERFWSPGNVKDVDDMYRRLEITSFRLEELGLLHNKNYEMFLRRLTNNRNIEPLRTLVDVIEPLKGYRRGSKKRHYSYSPLTRVVDAARPDAETAREFRKMVDTYLSGNTKDPLKYEAIREKLIIWKNNHADLLEIIRSSPVLREIETLSEDLEKIAEIGLNAIVNIQNSWYAESGWVSESLKTVESAKESRGQCEIMIISAIEKLVKAAGN
ncbi:beta-N-acetylhexosaminidase [candidate division KSB1 bacterium]